MPTRALAPPSTSLTTTLCEDRLWTGQPRAEREREFFIDNLLVRIHFTIVMIRWTSLAPRAETEVIDADF